MTAKRILAGFALAVFAALVSAALAQDLMPMDTSAVDPECGKVFPVMEEIGAWRLMESWGIDLVDAVRKTRIRFTMPDAAYIIDPEADGIFTILQPER